MTQTRYKRSSDPIKIDGRNIDTSAAELSGEAASQAAERSPDEHIEEIVVVWRRLPEPSPADPTYYERPLLNRSVWTWAIPTYYFVGGLTGAALVLAAAAQIRTLPETRRLVRRLRWIAVAGAGVSAALLIYDLGRPTRFLNMLRVFRPTSPMNLGAWILSGSGASAFASLVLPGRIAETAGFLGGIFGMGLATYTGVLVANTAVPLWQESRCVLPVLFGCSAISSIDAALELLASDPAERRIAMYFGLTGKLSELAASLAMEKQVSRLPRVGRPLRRGVSGFLWRTAQLLTGASLAVSVLPQFNGWKRRRIASGLLGLAGALIVRFAVESAGNASASDPRASFHLQRAGSPK
jgi:formate-dependent nitrite reductase membrane component NrfD